MSVVKRSHIHFKCIIPLWTYSGLWQYDLKGFKGFMYNLYYYLSFTYVSLCTLSEYYTLYDAIKKGATSPEIANIITHIVFDSLFIIRGGLYRTPAIKKLLEKILKIEETIFEKSDEECREVYMKNVAVSKSLAYFAAFQGFMTLTGGEIFPVVKTFLINSDDKQFYILRMWLFFDEYYRNIICQLVCCILGGPYSVCTVAFLLLILKNITGQLLVLQHRFATIYEKAVKVSEKDGISFKESCNFVLKDCIRQHQEIISMVEDLDNFLGLYMFVEYVMLSFGFCAMVLTFLWEENFLMRVNSVALILMFSFQPSLIYYYADELATESSYGLTQAIFESKWMDIDLNAQKMLTLVMLRAQEPLMLSIGPFKKVCVDSMLSMFQGAYSYLSVMWK